MIRKFCDQKANVRVLLCQIVRPLNSLYNLTPDFSILTAFGFGERIAFLDAKDGGRTQIEKQKLKQKTRSPHTNYL